MILFIDSKAYELSQILIVSVFLTNIRIMQFKVFYTSFFFKYVILSETLIHFSIRTQTIYAICCTLLMHYY